MHRKCYEREHWINRMVALSRHYAFLKQGRLLRCHWRLVIQSFLALNYLVCILQKWMKFLRTRIVSSWSRDFNCLTFCLIIWSLTHQQTLVSENRCFLIDGAHWTFVILFAIYLCDYRVGVLEVGLSELAKVIAVCLQITSEWRKLKLILHSFN